MTKFDATNVEKDDYVLIEYYGWCRVTGTNMCGFWSVNSSRNEMIHLPFSDISDLKLESEMPVGENF